MASLILIGTAQLARPLLLAAGPFVSLLAPPQDLLELGLYPKHAVAGVGSIHHDWAVHVSRSRELPRAGPGFAVKFQGALKVGEPAGIPGS